jgi:hypothetical protein
MSELKLVKKKIASLTSSSLQNSFTLHYLDLRKIGETEISPAK